MSNSSLVNYTCLSPNCSKPRNKKISKITIHHMAGNLSVEACGNIFLPTSRKASSNYGIGTDGRIGLYVEETNRAWTSSNAENDNMAVTIEVANNSGEPNWTVSDKAYESLINLCVDICRRNGIERLNYTGDKTGNLTMHCWFAATVCPGPYLKSKFQDIANKVNARLGNIEPKSIDNNPPTMDVETYIWERGMQEIGNPFGVAGIMGNWDKESGLKTNNLQNSFNTKLGMTDDQYTKAVNDGTYTNFVHDQAGYGLAQWTFWSRKQALLNYMKSKNVSIDNIKEQVNFAFYELKTSYKSVFNVLKNASSVQEASDVVLTQYEKPANQSQSVKNERANAGLEIYKRHESNCPTPTNKFPYLVKIATGSNETLNVRQGPSTSYKINTEVRNGEVYTIVDESNGWGKLKSGAGWISLKFTKKV